MEIEMQRNNSIQKRPVDQSMKKFERNNGRILPNAEPVSIVRFKNKYTYTQINFDTPTVVNQPMNKSNEKYC